MLSMCLVNNYQNMWMLLQFKFSRMLWILDILDKNNIMIKNIYFILSDNKNDKVVSRKLKLRCLQK